MVGHRTLPGDHGNLQGANPGRGQLLPGPDDVGGHWSFGPMPAATAVVFPVKLVGRTMNGSRSSSWMSMEKGI